MPALATVDFLADIQFIDYWDAEFLLNDITETAADFLANIQFVDYWDTEFCSNDSECTSLDDWDADVSLDN